MWTQANFQITRSQKQKKGIGVGLIESRKIPSEMEVAPCYSLLTLFTLLTLLTLIILFKLLNTAETVACMPIYIVRES